jgi:hypothetical protein
MSVKVCFSATYYYFRNFLKANSAATLAANKPSMPGSGTTTAVPAIAVAESVERISPVVTYFIVNLPFLWAHNECSIFQARDTETSGINDLDF